MNLFHSSKTPGITTLTPYPHNAVDGEKVVFATNDKYFALAMTYCTGNELAVGFFVNTKTGEKQMYIDELEEGKLEELNQPGSLYEVNGGDFHQDDRLMPEEFISFEPVKVLREHKIENVLGFLRETDVQIVEYKNVLTEMKNRGKDPENPELEHADNRFRKI